MNIDYTSLQTKAATLLTDVGVAWQVTRKGISLGKAYGIRTTAKNSIRNPGLLLASNKNVDLVLSAVFELKPGDDISTIGETPITYTIVEVNRVQPALTTIIYKVVAA